MAEAALSAFLQVVFEKLASPILEEFGLWWGVRKEVDGLTSKLSTIEAVLEDAEQQQRLKDKAVQNWLRKLRDAAYDADDILDEFMTEALRRKVEVRGRVTKKVSDFFSPSNQVVFRLRVAHKVKENEQRLDAIAEERSKFHFHAREGVQTVPEISSRGQTESSVIEPEVSGREEDKEKLLELLITAAAGDDEEEGLSVIPIVGMGGVGKTTLAQLAYNDARVEKHFDRRIWVCVSDDFDVGRITKAIIDSATNSRCDLQDLNLLQRRLREELGGRKFLLVLDDVWEENPEKWDQLRKFLQGGSRGSKIIVTTRKEVVASIMGTRPSSYQLATLSDDDCWSIFKHQAFKQGRQEEPNLVTLGRQIVKKCGGIPLAAKALGALMHLKREEREWQFVKDNELLNTPVGTDRILPVLRLSYYNLPSHLKQCFAYCSIFPKDYDIGKKKLIRLWMAQGFIRPSQGSKQMEEYIGEEYFNELLSQCFFQDIEKDDDGNIVQCKMHDLMHDLAQSVAGDECSIVNAKSEVSIPDTCRHLFLLRNYYESNESNAAIQDLLASNKVKNVRTFMWQKQRQRRSFSLSFLCLRVLDLHDSICPKDLLTSIVQLKHLRYLDLSHTVIRSLPESFTTLYNLQALILKGCTRLKSLPRGMRKMISLRHLEIQGCDSLTRMPAKMGELKFLQTLSLFIIGKDSGFGISELGGLRYLAGKLEIKKLENVRGAREAQEAKLNEKPNLQELTFQWISSVDINDAEQTFDSLHPHPNLKRLTVRGYPGVRFPHWMYPSLLPNLVEVKLVGCKRCEQIPPLGGLSCLKILYLGGMPAVKCIGDSFYGSIIESLSSLEELTLFDMPELKEWSAVFNGRIRQNIFPRLKELIIDRCPKLTTTPSWPQSSLKGITLLDTNEVLLGSLAHLTSLSFLSIGGFEEAEALPDGFFRNHIHLSKLDIHDFPKLESLSVELGDLNALEDLTITNCPKLVALTEELQNLTSLRRLCITDCNGLTSLRLQGLTSLQDLFIQQCQSLTSLLWGRMQDVTSLEGLVITSCPELNSLFPDLDMPHLLVCDISDCDKLACLPEALKHATRLRIERCPSLTALPDWSANLSSLRELYISGCANLVSLPSGLQHLTKLTVLYISDCPQLQKRCEREKGEDWHKIAHIPKIIISGWDARMHRHSPNSFLSLTHCFRG